MDEERYLRIDQIWTSLDGVHRHRIPTLRAAHGRVPGPEMIVAVYQQSEEGEVALGSEEGLDVRVDRIEDLGRDGRRQLVLRVGNGGSSPGCSWLSIVTVDRSRLIRLVPPRTIHELKDVDGDGRFEALSLVTGLDGFAGLSTQFSPRLERVFAYRSGRYVEADRDFGRHHWRRLAELRRTLERPVLGQPGAEQVGLAVSLYLEHEVLGQPRDGLSIATHFLKWVIDRGDLRCRRSAERALTAIEARVDHLERQPRPSSHRLPKG